MAAILVTYDLNKLGQDYAALDEVLDSYPTHWRFQRSAWIIDTDETEFDVASKLAALMDSNDVLFVTRVAETASWWGYDEEGDRWFQSVI